MAPAAGILTLVYKGYQGAGIAGYTPRSQGNHLVVNNRAYNALLTGGRSIGERANALLTPGLKT